MKILRNCIIAGLFAAFLFFLLAVSYSFFLPDLSVYALVLAITLVFIVFELGILAGVIIIKVSSISAGK